jgi:DNA-binding NarL/FixJ family response regulator
MKRISVFLADDHTIIRAGLRALLDLEPDIEVIGEAQDGREAVEMTARLRPSVVVMDHFMPSLNGVEAARQILKSQPDVKVLILSAQGSDACVIQAAQFGVSGFLLKQDASRVLPEAIRAVYAGKGYLSATIAARQQVNRSRLLGNGLLRQGKTEGSLSSREMEVLQLVAEGKTNKEMAAELGISTKTVEKHRQSLMVKLNIHDVAGLTRHAISIGIIAIEPASIADTSSIVA